MEKKEMLLALIESLKEELAKRQSKLQEIVAESFDIKIQEEQSKLVAELNIQLENFKANLEITKRANAENVNLDILAINRILADKSSELCELEKETSELASIEIPVEATIV